jgi:hypothetical protein
LQSVHSTLLAGRREFAGNRYLDRYEVKGGEISDDGCLER